MSVESVTKIIYEIEEMQRLYEPLIQYVMPIRRELDMAGTPTKGRKAKLRISSWRDQYKDGIERVLGMDIVWLVGPARAGEGKRQAV